MTTIRVRHSHNYTCISNQTLRDVRLSFRARGLHHLLLSYPDNWTISTAQLLKESPKEGRDAIATALKELEIAGYISRAKVRDPKTGKLDWESVIRELPINGFSGNGEDPPKRQKKSRTKVSTVDGSTVDGSTVDGSTVDGSTVDGSTVDGKSGHIRSTDQVSTVEQVLSEEISTLKSEGEKKGASHPEEESEPSTDRSPASTASDHNESTTQRDTAEDQGSAAPARDFFAERVKNGNHPHPDMVREGLGHLWVGPKRNDFAEALIQGAIAHLKKYEKPADRGDAITHIHNLIHSGKWGVLEQREQEGRRIAQQTEQQQQTIAATIATPQPAVQAEEDDSDFDPNSPEAIAARERIRAMLGFKPAAPAPEPVEPRATSSTMTPLGSMFASNPNRSMMSAIANQTIAMQQQEDDYEQG